MENIVVRLKIPLGEREFSALQKIADAEFRNPTDQVRFILRSELERRGFLKFQDPIQIHSITVEREIECG